ncbi:uncharacterized protein A4U43_C08F31180 [Asparagus officinalis]|uniref:uncharacterized protein LOC109820403 n=1 Tax=Asparagus officinalis TaxID=4686 RepID=UPI00098E8683|nr:uncharacterized protein LOC109820403 [Asparagus officinalis]ONK61555.1 uncharacterized protein A4U43_C08F31180 [Asparagus officinalis]
MEKYHYRAIPVVCSAVVIMGMAAFTCCLTAEFKKSKSSDMGVNGSTCCMRRSPAFGLGISALVLLSIAQIAGTTVAATGTTVAATRLCSRDHKPRRTRILSIVFLTLSWISFGLAAILLGTGSSMNNKQPYGRGWMKGECYVVKDGVFAGSAVLTATTVLFIIGFTFTTTERLAHRRTSPDEERNQQQQQQQQQPK